MSIRYEVPEAVQRVARGALHLQRRNPLAGVGRPSMARWLASGAVTAETVLRLRRFFAINERECRQLRAIQHTEANSPALRTWNLYGGDTGKNWVTSLHLRLVRKEDVDADPTLELLKCSAEEVYSRFAFNSWRYEFGLTPEKAARFVEHYVKATGNHLDVQRAFGEGWRAVNSALWRRIIPNEDPFRVAMKLAKVGESAEVRLAAARDCARIKLQETSEFLTLTPKACTSSVLPKLFASCVLACVEPALLRSITPSTPLPWDANRKDVTVEQSTYAEDELAELYLTFFHGSSPLLPEGITEKCRYAVRDLLELLRSSPEEATVDGCKAVLREVAASLRATVTFATWPLETYLELWSAGAFEEMGLILPPSSKLAEAWRAFLMDRALGPLPTIGLTVEPRRPAPPLAPMRTYAPDDADSDGSERWRGPG